MSLIVTNKQLDTIALLLRPTTRFLTLEGATRSSKTADLIQAFFYAVYDSNERQHAICGYDYDTINRNILYAKDVGLLETHPELEMKKRQQGGYYIEMQSSKGVKEILLAGYADGSKWKKILGGTLGVVLIDEVNIAHADFVRETLARQTASDNPKSVFTLNGDDPNHYIYQEYINYSKVIGNAPESTKQEMKEFQKKNGTKVGYYYKFYSMSDNPIMTEEKINNAMSIYPVGSYYYLTKLLGERGRQGELIYADYMSRDLLVDGFSRDYYRYTIGVDIGETRASNVFALVGWGLNYSTNTVLLVKDFVRVGYEKKKELLFQWLEEVTKLIPSGLIECISVDSAEANFIEDLREPIKVKYNIDVIPSYKATIKQRIDMNIVGYSSKRTLIDKRLEKVYNAFIGSTWAKNKIGQERFDCNTVNADIRDAVEYAQTRHMKALMRAGD